MLAHSDTLEIMRWEATAIKFILLSGGSGSRLWPLSTESLPKPYLKIMRNTDGTLSSMLQRTWETLADKYGAEHLFVAAGTSQEALLREQLGPDVQLILEPSRRDTFPAIAFACASLAEYGTEADETVVVLPVDTYADPDFYDKLAELDHIIRERLVRLALIGIRPAFPSDKFGYILTSDKLDSSALTVDKFLEKPDLTVAADLIRQGALWNGGIFAFRLQYMLDKLAGLNLPIDRPGLEAAFDKIPRISFDYMVIETETSVACVRYDGRWSDLGTWSEIVRLLDPYIGANVVMDEYSTGTHVINQLPIPIVVSGVPNVVIAAGPDGILISDQKSSHLIKPLIDQVNAIGR